MPRLSSTTRTFIAWFILFFIYSSYFAWDLSTRTAQSDPMPAYDTELVVVAVLTAGSLLSGMTLAC